MKPTNAMVLTVLLSLLVSCKETNSFQLTESPQAESKTSEANTDTASDGGIIGNAMERYENLLARFSVMYPHQRVRLEQGPTFAHFISLSSDARLDLNVRDSTTLREFRRTAQADGFQPASDYNGFISFIKYTPSTFLVEYRFFLRASGRRVDATLLLPVNDNSGISFILGTFAVAESVEHCVDCQPIPQQSPAPPTRLP